MNIVDELKRRKLLYAVTDEAVKEHFDEGKVTFYLGADPTSDSLHVGHLVPYIIAKHLIDAGHEAILLIGGGTGLIGDPSGKSEERKLLELEDTLANASAIEAQVKRLIPEARIVNNYDWLKDYDMIRFLRDIGKHFNLNYMMGKDSVKNRLDSGISFTEFSYQIIQSIDFMELYGREGCTVQIGGQDQWGNITAGLELIRKLYGPGSKAYGLVAPLLTRKDGSKFGKTAEGTIWLDPAKTSPYAFYQYWINLEDDEALRRLWQFTFLRAEEIDEVEARMQKTPHERHAQKTLAREVTRFVHGQKALQQAENITGALFGGEVSSLTPEEIEMGFEGVPSIHAEAGKPLIEALVETGLANSKREARTFLRQNAVRLNGERVERVDATLDSTDALHGSYHVIRRGKKHYALVRL